jgi:chorismate--pyruvate lyase
MLDKSWLTFRGSLTEKMQEASGRPIKVRITAQGMAPVFEEERRCLGLSLREWAWIREVELSIDRQPWLLARTIVPRRSLVGELKRIKLLGERPLGPLLFNQLNAERCDIDFTEVEQVPWSQQQFQQKLWCRRSLFSVAQHPLLLKELFLPDHPLYGHTQKENP